MEFAKIKGNQEEIRIGKIVCVGQNYAAHIEEMGSKPSKFPVVFLKTASCIIPSGGEIVHPDYSTEMHHEIELVLLIGETVKNGTPEEAERAIAGYAVGLDMTLRDLQSEYKSKGQPWTLAKVFDTSGVLTEFVKADEYSLNLDETISLSVNGIERQNSKLKAMLFNPIEIVEYLSSRMTLEKGDLIYTGTPAGVGKVIPGDKISGRVENIRELEASIV